MYRFIAFALFGYILNGQTQKATKPFTPPEEFYAFQPLIAKDAGCAKDYAKAMTLSGIEQRKMLADLVRYECAESTPGTYRVLIRESKDFQFGNQRVQMVRVNLGANLDVLPMTQVYRVGWIPRSRVVTKREIEAKQKK